MSEFRFIKYEATPIEKHVGIMTVLVRGIVLRYKIVKTKDGSATFPATASYKMSGEQEEGRYLSSFSLDSQSEQEMLFDFIKEKFAEIQSKSHQKSPTLNNRSLVDVVHEKLSNTHPDRSNAESETFDDIPF